MRDSMNMVNIYKAILIVVSVQYGAYDQKTVYQVLLVPGRDGPWRSLRLAAAAAVLRRRRLPAGLVLPQGRHFAGERVPARRRAGPAAAEEEGRPVHGAF
jgi:hypothetical protein